MQFTAENSLEDYWEDSSVSWGCRGLSFTSSFHKKKQEVQSEGTVDKPPSCMQDFHIATSTLRPRNFPPPIALCTTQSIKSGGRFVLKEMASQPAPSHALRAEREKGRLCLHLIELQQLDEEEEEEDDDDYDNFCNLEDPLVCADLHQQEQQDGHEALGTQDNNVRIISHQKAEHCMIQGMPEDIVCTAFGEDMPEEHTHTEEALRKECYDKNKDVVSFTSEKHAMDHIETRDNSIGSCMPSIAYADVESKECMPEHIEIKNSSIGSGVHMGALGISQHQRTSLWSKEGSNGIAASFIPCSSKQVLSFARTSPLAVS